MTDGGAALACGFLRGPTDSAWAAGYWKTVDVRTSRWSSVGPQPRRFADEFQLPLGLLLLDMTNVRG
jgi:hypothetical protein